MIDFHRKSSKKVDIKSSKSNSKELFREPTVELIASFDKVAEVYKNSRPGVAPEEVAKDLTLLNNINLSVSSMKAYIFNITSSFLFKQFISSIRGVNIWSTSKRLLGMNNLKISSEVKETSSEKYSLDNYKKAFNLYEKSHDMRAFYSVIPASILVSYTIEVTDQVLSDILTTIKTSYPLFSSYIKLFNITSKKGTSLQNAYKCDKILDTTYKLETDTYFSRLKFNLSLFDYDTIINHPYMLVRYSLFNEINSYSISLGKQYSGVIEGIPEVVNPIAKIIAHKLTNN